MIPAGASLDLGQALLNGFVVGLVIMISYMIQKMWERKATKYRMAVIMSDEIRSIMYVAESRISPIMPENHRIPTQDVYRGLLNSGRIVHFEGSLRSELAEIYYALGKSSFKVDTDLCSRVSDKLEKIKPRNRVLRRVLGWG